MATFTKEQVKRIGDLAAIALTDDEATSLESELNGLAESIDELNTIPTACSSRHESWERSEHVPEI